MFDIVTWPRYLFKRYYLRQSVKKEKTSFLVSGDLTCFNINIESRYLLGIFTIRGKFCFKLLGQVNKFWISVIREFISVSEWCWQENSSSIFLRFMHSIANSQNPTWLFHRSSFCYICDISNSWTTFSYYICMCKLF